jgi:hypothetical protein
MDWRTEDAIAKFRKLERMLLNRDIAEYALEQALRGQVNMKQYQESTEKIRREFEGRREALTRSKRLP